MPTTKATGTGLAAPVVIEAGYYVVGTMNNWKSLADYKMTADGTGYVLKKTLEAGTYEFKVKKEPDNTWYPGENVKFEVKTAGEVTFAVAADNKVTISGDCLAKDIVEEEGDISMVLPLVLVLFGGAAVVFASKKRFA